MNTNFVVAESEPHAVTAESSASFVKPCGRALRKSCDRCYAQKLKCKARDPRSGRCIRCQRAGSTCTYSSRSPSKRSVLPKAAAVRGYSPSLQQQAPSSFGDNDQAMMFDISMPDDFDIGSVDLVSSAFSGTSGADFDWPFQAGTAWEDPAGISASQVLPNGTAPSLKFCIPLETQISVDGPAGELPAQTCGNGHELSNQHSMLLVELSCVSRQLEVLHHDMADTELSGDLHDCRCHQAKSTL